MAADTQTSTANALPPPRTEVGVIGWMHANLFSSRLNSALTVVSGALALVILWYGMRWVFWSADWTVVERVGGLFLIGSYNTELACPGQNCFWRPQVSLLLVTALLGMIWGILGGGVAKRIAILTAVVAALFAFLPYSLERMGWDVRILLLANLPSTAIGWAVARYTPLGQPRWVVAWGVVVFLITLVLQRGLPNVPGLQPVSVVYWGGLTLNLILAVGGISLSLPIGIALALGRRSNLPMVKLLCVVFIEVFRGVPLITLLFMSQTLVPLAFPEDFPQNSLFRAAVVITLFSSAYMAENIRGGLQALHPGQAEAARALGLPGWQTTMLISLPQAIRNVIPAIVGQFIALFKDTSLVYIIGMVDIVEIGRVFISRPEYLPSAREMFVFLAVVFWVFCYAMSYVSRHIERNLGVGER
ncbi:MAG: amino acid ABC transporter permease [Chloroflexi bacterium]|nr:amino acid ABC transporter permease [Chloroflexota bacterium]MYD47759.1 amino acid ABC transporter permease [Chloroflexota bacterium]